MKYLINKVIDWADEFDVYFVEVLDESKKRIYMAAKKVWGSWYDSYYFGTNEGWDNDFNYLGFDLIELSDQEASVFEKYHVQCESIFDTFLDHLFGELMYSGFIKDDESVDFLFEKSESELVEYFTKVKEAAE